MAIQAVRIKPNFAKTQKINRLFNVKISLKKPLDILKWLFSIRINYLVRVRTTLPPSTTSPDDF